VPDLAPLLWHSFGTVAALLQEIIAVYPMINPPNLTAHQSNRVCNALALLQCVASHPETRSAFLSGLSVLGDLINLTINCLIGG
jgi:CCR4-NOT transcription complex subunit 9